MNGYEPEGLNDEGSDEDMISEFKSGVVASVEYSM